MNCKDCINSDVCNCFDDEATEMIAMNLEGEECKLFKDKSRYKEVVHGEWLDYCGEDQCSICGETTYYLKNNNFCPNCGADMRNKEREQK